METRETEQAAQVQGRNVRIEERWANGDYQILPALAVRLPQRAQRAQAAAMPPCCRVWLRIFVVRLPPVTAHPLKPAARVKNNRSQSDRPGCSRDPLAVDCCAVNDKQILITGATNGIGLAAAEALAALGANLAIVGRSKTRIRIASARTRAAARKTAERLWEISERQCAVSERSAEVG